MGSMSIDVTYLAPAPNPLNGISHYATLLTSALNKYAPELRLHRVDEDTFESLYPTLPKNALVMAEMSLGEGAIFRALHRQRLRRPDLKRVMTIHDSPRFAVETTTTLAKMSGSWMGRAARRLFLDRLDWMIERQMVLSTDVLICLTPLGKELLEEKIKRTFLVRPRVEYMPHLLYLDPPETAQLNLNQLPRVGHFGYVNPHKGLHVLIDAANRLKISSEKCPTIIIYGEPITARGDAYFRDIVQRVSGYGLSDIVRFEGYLPTEKIPTFLASLDALALPYSELGFVSASGVLQWSRSIGVPVLAGKTRAFASLVQDGVDGRVIPTSDIEAWKTALNRIAERSDEWKTLRQGVTRTRRAAEWKSVADRLSVLLHAQLQI